MSSSLLPHATRSARRVALFARPVRLQLRPSMSTERHRQTRISQQRYTHTERTKATETERRQRHEWAGPRTANNSDARGVAALPYHCVWRRAHWGWGWGVGIILLLCEFDVARSPARTLARALLRLAPLTRCFVLSLCPFVRGYALVLRHPAPVPPLSIVVARVVAGSSPSDRLEALSE